MPPYPIDFILITVNSEPGTLNPQVKINAANNGPMNIASLTIFYNPQKAHFQNILSYANQVDWLIFVDNSSTSHYEEIQRVLPEDKKRRMTYLPNFANHGVGQALNTGAAEALGKGFSMLLTLDQDSRVTEHMTEKLKNAYERLITIGEKPVLVSALQVQKESFEYWSKKNASNNNESFMFPLVVPTSGNLLNLHAHRELGGFREDYFIDDVDHEFCLRARQKGYILAQVPWAPLVHNCGNAYKRGSGAKNQKVVYEHPPLRHYFMMRNRLFTCTRYIYFHFPLVMFFYLKIIFFQIIGALVFERQRAKKLRCILLGILDWSRKISGPKIL